MLAGKPGKTYYFDDAITLTGNGRLQRRVFVLFAIAIVCVMVEGTCMAYVLPTAKCDLNITLREQGFIYSVGYIGIVLTSHFWGFLADTWGRRKVLLLSTFFTFAFGTMSSLSVNGTMMLVTRFAVGLS